MQHPKSHHPIGTAFRAVGAAISFEEGAKQGASERASFQGFHGPRLLARQISIPVFPPPHSLRFQFLSPILSLGLQPLQIPKVNHREPLLASLAHGPIWTLEDIQMHTSLYPHIE